jgi:hypothetical protein
MISDLTGSKLTSFQVVQRAVQILRQAKSGKPMKPSIYSFQTFCKSGMIAIVD